MREGFHVRRHHSGDSCLPLASPQGSRSLRPRADGSDAATPATPNGSGPRPDGAPRRRRRGSRGGRNRKRPATASGAAGAVGRDGSTTTDDEPDDCPTTHDERRQPQSYFDAEADRGLTGDDIAETAREEAGLAGTTATGAPRVGDVRPAPAGIHHPPAAASPPH